MIKSPHQEKNASDKKDVDMAEIAEASQTMGWFASRTPMFWRLCGLITIVGIVLLISIFR